MTDLKLTPAVDFELLVLIGGGEFSFGETREIDEFLLAQLPPQRKRIAFLPTASGSAEYASHIGKYFATIDPEATTTNVPVYRGRDNRRQKSLNMLLDAGLVYLGGGVGSRLIETVKESPAELALRDLAERGTPVAAIGAAAASFGVLTWDGRGGTMPGLGWLKETVVEPSFDRADDTHLRRLMSLPDVALGIGIPPGTAIAIARDGSTRVFGSGTIAVFRKRPISG
jgi:cyanophycinase-like exopeptidase